MIIIEYIEIAINEARKAQKRKDVPIGAVIIRNNKVVAKASNKKIKTNDVTQHAEIIAIKKAAKKLKDWRLSDCDLYVTLKPCAMCMEVIKESRIKNVYYLIEKEETKKGYNRTNVQILNNNEKANKYIKELSDFFRLNCKR